MENEVRIEKAKEIKAVIDQTKPVTAWRFTCVVRTAPKVQVVVNDQKGKAAAILTIGQDGALQAEWQSGHSLTRNELRAALGVR